MQNQSKNSGAARGGNMHATFQHPVTEELPLPPEMFYQILNNLDTKSLLTSREVCSSFRNKIDDNGKLIKSLTFTVTDIKAFMNSRLASKVKSVRFIQPLQGTEKDLKDFFTKIGSTVEEVFVEFEGHRGTPVGEKLLLSMILRFCPMLNSLIITTDKHPQKDEEGNDIGVYDFLKSCTQDPRSAVAFSAIQNLSVMIIEVEDFIYLKEFLLSLPNLRQLNLKFDNSNCEYSEIDKIRDIVLEYLEKYNGNLQEITLQDKIVDVDKTKTCYNEFLSVQKMYPNIKIDCRAYLNELLIFESGEANYENDSTLKYIKTAEIYLDSFDTIDTSRIIGLCSNLHSLDIDFDNQPQISPSSFEFINELKKLKNLKIMGSPWKGFDQGLSSQTFSFGIPLVTDLVFGGHGVGLNSISFHQCFPNLTKLCVDWYENDLNVDFIYNLTTLDQLTSLEFRWISELTDQHFIQTYDFIPEKDGKVSKLAAIAGFKSLRSLYIGRCNKLTDNCLTNGLALCDKLEKITLRFFDDGLITEAGLNSLQQARNFTVEDITTRRKKSDGMESRKITFPPEPVKILMFKS